MVATDPVQIVCPHDGAINRVPAGREVARQSGAMTAADHIVAWVRKNLPG